jgi:hypothetical protein
MKKFESRALINAALFPILLMLWFGCAGRTATMRDIPSAEVPAAIQSDKARIVFMRPSMLGFAVQSSVFEIVSGEPELIGIVSAQKKVGFSCNPGKHLFMVIGESADFMSADVIAGKTYYAVVVPRMGMWKARFSLRPVLQGEHLKDEFKQWDRDCQWTEKTSDADQWAFTHLSSIKSKQESDMTKWLQRPEGDRPALLPDDGI